MGKELEKLERELAEAYTRNEAAADAAEQARESYRTATVAGNMDKAAQCQHEADLQTAEARRWKDRVSALESRRVEAERIDKTPAYQEALKAADAAMKDEAVAHAAFVELVGQLADLRIRLDAVHSNAWQAVAHAYRTAKDAHLPPPNLVRSRMCFETRERMLALAHEVSNVGNFQDRQVHEQRQNAAA